MSDVSLTTRRMGAVLRRIDRVWLALALLFLALALGMPAQALESLRFTLESFIGILPFLTVSVLLAAWLKAAGADRLIGARVSESVVLAIVAAAAFGAFSPFCSCGVVPLIAALLAAGVPLPAVMAFWVASPIMDPEMFVLMWAQLGLPFTLAKAVAALGVGLLGGFATLGLERAGLLSGALRAEVGCGSCGSACAAPVGPVDLRWAFWRDATRRAAFGAESREVAYFLSKWLLLAFALESLMVAWIPGELIANNLGGGEAIPLAVILGVPAYLNGYAAIPLIGELMNSGMAPPAALAFLVAGGITSLPAAMAVYAIVRLRLFVWYVVLALIGSLVVGYAYAGWLLL